MTEDPPGASDGVNLMKWFRFYNEVYRNDKVQSLRPELFRFWVNLCRDCHDLFHKHGRLAK
jgi:hypothetical protein